MLEAIGDGTYAVGQKLVVREAAVLRLADLVESLAGELRGLRQVGSTGGGAI